MKRIALVVLGFVFWGLCACTALQFGIKTVPTWQEQYDLGLRYLSEGNYEEAILAFTAAIEIDPKQAPAYVGRGNAYVLFGETEENLTAAQADYEKAIELDETNADAYLGLADVYIRQGEYDKAYEILNLGIEKTDSEALKNMLSIISSKMEVYNTEDLFTSEELTIGGIPFWQLTLNDVMELYPDGMEYLSDYSIYIVEPSGVKYFCCHVNFSESGMAIGVSYFYSDSNRIGLKTELRDICGGQSLTDVLLALGFSTSIVEKAQFMKSISIYIDNNRNIQISELGESETTYDYDVIIAMEQEDALLVLRLLFDDDGLNNVLYILNQR